MSYGRLQCEGGISEFSFSLILTGGCLILSPFSKVSLKQSGHFLNISSLFFLHFSDGSLISLLTSSNYPLFPRSNSLTVLPLPFIMLFNFLDMIFMATPVSLSIGLRIMFEHGIDCDRKILLKTRFTSQSFVYNQPNPQTHSLIIFI